MKYLTKHGNSWALVIDKPVLELLQIDPSTTPVEMRTNGKNLVIEPVNESRRGELIERHGRTRTRSSGAPTSARPSSRRARLPDGLISSRPVSLTRLHLMRFPAPRRKSERELQ